MRKRQSVQASFKNAAKGIGAAFAGNRNIKIMLTAAVMALIGGIFLQITATEWAIVFVCTGTVIGVELLNTAIEQIMDLLHPEFDERVGKIKDIAAGAALIASIAAACAGAAVFVPKLIQLFANSPSD